MLPTLEDTRWRKLVSGKINHDFKCVPAGLMISRLKREFQADASDANVNKLLSEAYVFFQKYERIVQDDLNAIFT